MTDHHSTRHRVRKPDGYMTLDYHQVCQLMLAAEDAKRRLEIRPTFRVTMPIPGGTFTAYPEPSS